MEKPAELKERLMKEAQAMVSYIADRGIDKDLPAADLMAMLDLDAEARKAVTLGNVLALHQALARIVSPAFPETICKLHEYREKRGWWRRLAPLNPILWLIVSTFLLICAIGYGLSQHSHVPLPAGYLETLAKDFGESPVLPNADGSAGGSDLAEVRVPYFQPVIEYLQGKCRLSVEELAAIDDKIDESDSTIDFNRAVQQHLSDCQDLRRPIMLRIFMFFGALGMLGAAYSSIYDSFSYIREGRYDMRLASTYYVRIFLGGFSGVLLAEPLSDFLEQGVLSSALLAFIGGFSAQLVYDLLTKLVDSVWNMFREDRRKERQSILAQAEYGALGAIQQQDAMRRQELAKLLAEAQQEADPEKRAGMMQDGVLGMMAGAPEPSPSGNALGEMHSALVGRLRQALGFSELSRYVAPLLPDAAPRTEAAAAAAQGELTQALQKVRDGAAASGDLAAAQTALERAGGSDLVTGNLHDAITALRDQLDGSSLRAAVRGALAAPAHLDGSALQRWRHVAYRAARPVVALLDGIEPADLDRGLAIPGGGELPAPVLIEALRSGGVDAAFAQVAEAFADRPSFETALEGWIDATVRRVLAGELKSRLEPITGGLQDAESVVEALSKVAARAAARGGLQRLELLGSALPKTAEPEQRLADLLALVDVKLAGEAR